MEFKPIEQVLDKTLEGKQVAIRGWVYRKRDQKEIIFLTLRDSSDLIQAIVKKESKAWKEAEKITIESSCEVEGTIKEDKRAPTGFELQVTDLKIVGLAERYPISKDLSDEFLLDVRHLSVRMQKLQQVWKIRSKVFTAFREFFLQKGYYETHAPFFTKTSESGLELFEVDYFGKKVRLAQTWQFYAEALLPALEKIFTKTCSISA